MSKQTIYIYIYRCSIINSITDKERVVSLYVLHRDKTKEEEDVCAILFSRI